MMEEQLHSRIPEPEFMDPDEVRHFMRNNEVIFGPDRQYELVLEWIKNSGVRNGMKILDIGCGTANIAIYMAMFLPRSTIMAVDGDQRMVDRAKMLVDRYHLNHRVIVRKAHLPNDRPLERHEYFDFVFSRSTLHHFAESQSFWNAIRDNVKPSGAIMVYDLQRPESEVRAQELVHDSTVPEGLRSAYFASFMSAYRIEEVVLQIRQTGLGGMRILDFGGHHLLVYRRHSGARI
jgi:cyclopropane fatty-acyl-phospholipid synthase-like methyltransferase